MVYINLLPIREIKERIAAIQQLTLFGVILAALLVAVGFFWFYQTNIISGLGKDIASLEQEKKKYENVLKQIAKLEADKKLIESKIAVIKQLQKTKAITVHVLDEIAKLTPSKRLWLSSLNQSGFSVNLSGTALDNQTIATYMETLKTSPYISAVNLNSTVSKPYAGRTLKAFSLSCTIQLPETNDSKAGTENK